MQAAEPDDPQDAVVAQQVRSSVSKVRPPYVINEIVI